MGHLTFSFLVSLIVYAIVPADHHTVVTAHGSVSVLNSRYTGASSSFFIYFLVLGIQSIGRSLPFGLALGMSRRTYYTGTALLAVGLSFVNGLMLAIFQVIEQATNGWGVQMSFFRIAFVLIGPWYLTWLSTFVGLTLLFVYGMWYGIVYRRWGALGTIAFIAAQVTVALAAVVIITWAHGWTGRRALLHRPHRRWTDRAAGRAGGGPAGGRPRHHPPRGHLTPDRAYRGERRSPSSRYRSSPSLSGTRGPARTCGHRTSTATWPPTCCAPPSPTAASAWPSSTSDWRTCCPPARSATSPGSIADLPGDGPPASAPARAARASKASERSGQHRSGPHGSRPEACPV